jgi:hypothetical protein
LSDLIALAEAGLQGEEDEDSTGKLSELIALAEAGLEAQEDAFFYQAAEATNEAEAAYYKRQVDQGNAGQPSHMNEAQKDAFLYQVADEVEVAYYRREADPGNASEPSHTNEVVVEDWYSDDELLTDYVSD